MDPNLNFTFIMSKRMILLFYVKYSLHVKQKLISKATKKMSFCFSGTFLKKNECEGAQFFLLCQIIFFLFLSRYQCERLRDFIYIAFNNNIFSRTER